MALQRDGNHIRIQGDLVQFVEESVVRQVRLQDFLDKLEITTPATFPVLGRTQVFAHIEQVGGYTNIYALTEIPAGVRSISKNRYDGTARRYRLSFPWTYLWFVAQTSDTNINHATWSFTSYRIFHAENQYESIDTPMIPARVPNVYDDGRICWGATGVDPTMPLANRIDQLTNEWYVSRFNTDLDGSHSWPNGGNDFREWVEGTRNNPQWYRTWSDWTDPNVPKYTVRNLMETNGTSPFLEQIVLPTAIPEVPADLTFGRWDEWWMQLEPWRRTQARISLDNLAFDDPENVPEDLPEDVTMDDDGGIPIEFMR